ncbi:MAG TPA: squalene synthase HpnC [Vicinamibacterales bacterium]|nr:squalene synthase HpnC [Vicinamibacterales bacterium]
MVDLQAAYAACARACRTHYENFPVASILLPRRMRPHVAAIYAFARAADDFADEGDRPIEERQRLLRMWRERLREAVAGNTSTVQRPPEPGEPAHTREIFLALGVTVRRLQLPPALLEDQLSAFEQDLSTTRYATWAELFDYCKLSANPIGRLVLRIGGHAADDLDRWSDAICTALQLANFWQDVKSDYRRGRIYLPLDEMRAHRADERALEGHHVTPEWRDALAAAVGRTRTLFNDGQPLCDRLRGRLGWEIRLTWLGGTRILDRIEAIEFDVLNRRPTIGLADVPGLAAAALAGPRLIQKRAART